MTSIEREVGRRIRNLRARAGSTLEQVAGAAGIDPSFLWRIEQGRMGLGLGSAVALAHALGVRIEDLVDSREPSYVEALARRLARRLAKSPGWRREPSELELEAILAAVGVFAGAGSRGRSRRR